MSENKLRVLVLDDEPIVCKRLQPALEKLGFEVDTFTQSVEAMHQVQQSAYDIVITDLKMKEVDGMRFLEEVKKQRPETEVIVITGFATMETAKQSFQKGVFDFIAKPFKLSEIQDVVTRAAAKIRGTGAGRGRFFYSLNTYEGGSLNAKNPGSHRSGPGLQFRHSLRL
jgi:DNA-binding NtrC family response regulator